MYSELEEVEETNLNTEHEQEEGRIKMKKKQITNTTPLASSEMYTYVLFISTNSISAASPR